MILKYKPYINFYVKADQSLYVPTDTTAKYISIEWEHPSYLSRVRDRLYIPKEIKIERSLSIDGPYEVIATVDPLKLFYADKEGLEGHWYRLVLIANDGDAMEPTIAKTVGLPATSRIYGHCTDVSGQPIADLPIYFYAQKLPANNQVSGILLCAGPIEIKTDKAGYFETDLLVDSVVTVQCAQLGINKIEFKVPADISNNLFNLI